jgi:RNA polymerase sigma factor (sigma-70 family)
MVRNRRRKHRNRRRLLTGESLVPTDDSSVEQADLAEPQPDEFRLITLDEVLAKLADDERKVITKFAVGTAYKEIARELGKPLGSVKTLAHRARKKMAA